MKKESKKQTVENQRTHVRVGLCVCVCVCVCVE